MIENISKEEFEALAIVKKGPGLLPETLAVQGLNLGDAIKFPCRWKHGEFRCHRNIKATCRDGTVYVMRVA